MKEPSANVNNCPLSVELRLLLLICVSCSVVSDSVQSPGLAHRLLCPWTSRPEYWSGRICSSPGNLLIKWIHRISGKFYYLEPLNYQTFSLSTMLGHTSIEKLSIAFSTSTMCCYEDFSNVTF